MKLQNFFVHKKIIEIKKEIESIQESMGHLNIDQDGVISFAYFQFKRQKDNLEDYLARMESIIRSPDDDFPTRTA